MQKPKILVLQLSRYGDILMTLPLLEKLKKKYFVYLMINQIFADFPEINNYCDILIPVNFNDFYLKFSSLNLFESIKIFSEFILKLNSYNFDLILNLSSQPISAVITTIVNANKKFGLAVLFDRSFGESGKNVAFYFEMAEVKKYNWLHQSDIFKTVLDDEFFDYNHSIYFSKINNDILKKYNIELNEDEKIIGLQIGASLDKKEYSINNFDKLISLLNERIKTKIILFGSKNEIEKNKILSKKYSNIISLVGKTDLFDLISILSKLDLLITNDTGTMHFAAAVKTKIINISTGSAFFPETTAYSSDNFIIIPSLECYPCTPNFICSHQNCKYSINPQIIVFLALYLLLNDNEYLSKINYDFIYKTKFLDDGYLFFYPLKRRVINDFEFFGWFYHNFWKAFFKNNKFNFTKNISELENYYYLNNEKINLFLESIKLYFEKLKMLEMILVNINENNIKSKIMLFNQYFNDLQNFGNNEKFLLPLQKYLSVRFHSINTDNIFVIIKIYYEIINQLTNVIEITE
ncbi:MAG TPA: glycosyltransferase family 9 protein [bacterium]|nr:glycosyltransferase family 9 protein [bacterium]HOL48022.1 glycosyltransferase family 9 protein [bacterium]HPQ19570.1 glycosyltransferase family 9 protein [bacterium]